MTGYFLLVTFLLVVAQLRRIPFPGCILCDLLLLVTLYIDMINKRGAKYKAHKKLVTQCLDKQAKYWIDTQFFNHDSFQNLKLYKHIFKKCFNGVN